MNETAKTQFDRDNISDLGTRDFPQRTIGSSMQISSSGSNLVRDKDNVIVYRSIRAEWFHGLLLLIACIAVDMLTYSFSETVLSIPLFTLGTRTFGIVLPILLLLSCAQLLLIIKNVRNVRWVIGLTSLVELSGLTSFASRTREIYFENIRAIEVKQTLIERMLGIGSVKIGNLMSQDSDIELSGIRHPHQYKSVLERRVRSLKSEPH